MGFNGNGQAIFESKTTLTPLEPVAPVPVPVVPILLILTYYHNYTPSTVYWACTMGLGVIC